MRHAIARRSLLRLLTVSLGLASPALAQIVFVPPATTPLTHRTQGVITGDLNLDGHEDIIALPRFEEPFMTARVSVMLGNGDGTFGAPLVKSLNAQDAGHGEVTFLNGDAFPDLLLSAKTFTSGGDSLLFLFGAGDGTFPTSSEFGLNAIDIVDQRLVDLNGDGTRDYVVLDAGALIFFPGHLYTLVSFGTGYTIKTAATLPNATLHFTMADVNGDTLLDVVSTSATGAISIVAGTGGGNFAAPVNLAVGGQPAGLLVQDFDGDAIPDIVYADITLNRVVSMKGDGRGQFAQVQSLPVPGGPAELSAGTLDSDGALDLFVSLSVSGEMALVRGAGDGTFSHVATLSHVPAAGGSALADFDEDGRLDGAVGTFTEPGTVVVTRNACYLAGSPFTDLGHAKKGTNGWPVLLADGTLQVGDPFVVALANGKPLGNASLVLGFSQVNAPFKGGTMIPAVDLLITPLALDATGSVGLPVLWPPGIPSGFTFYLQFWFKDVGAVLNEAGSSGLRTVTP